jgi:Asp/Glu/hydantoin racemase
MLAAARPVAAPDTEIIPATAPRGVPYIATRAEAQLAGGVALEILAERQGQFDAAIMAAFGDPGLGGARELFPQPIIGLAEAGMLLACTLGRKFSIVTFATALEPWYRECVAMHGLEKRCSSIRALDGAFKSITSVQEEKERLLIDMALSAVAENEADVVVLAGAPLAGLASKVADRIPVPVIDCVGAAVKMAEAIGALAPRKATAGSFRRPAAKSSIDLPEALARWIAHET